MLPFNSTIQKNRVKSKLIHPLTMKRIFSISIYVIILVSNIILSVEKGQEALVA
jgi:hypothetical protein